MKSYNLSIIDKGRGPTFVVHFSGFSLLEISGFLQLEIHRINQNLIDIMREDANRAEDNNEQKKEV
jgi:hypothetical protein